MRKPTDAEVRSAILDVIRGTLDEVRHAPQPTRRIRISFSRYGFIGDRGDYWDEHGWEDEEGMTFAEVSDVVPITFVDADHVADLAWGESAVGEAVRFLLDAGVTEASSSRFHAGVWYQACQDEGWGDEHEDYHYHLEGFSEEEQRRIYEEVTS